MPSIISWLRQIQQGQVFLETFENPNFFYADGWQSLQGSPYLAQSSQAAFGNGIYSFSCGLSAAGTPVMKQSLPSYSIAPIVTQSATNVQMVVGWFFDDGTTSGNGPYLKAEDNRGNYVQVGARNNVSTTNYSVNNSGNFAQDNFASSSYARQTNEWNKFAFTLNASTGALSIYINNVQVFSGTPSSPGSSWSAIYVCANVVGDASASFGYFDNVACYQDVNTYVYFGSGSRNCVAYNNDPEVMNGPTVVSSLFATELDNYVSDEPYPVAMSFQLSQNGAYTNMALQSIFQNTNPGDVWILQEVDLPFRFKTYMPTDNKLSQVNVSNRGVTETLYYGQKNQVIFTSQALDGATNYKNFEEFMEWVGQGYPFMAMLDNVNDAFFGIISGNVPVGSTTIPILPEINGGVLINGGQLLAGFYVLRSADYTKKQVIQLSNSAAILTDNEGDILTDNEGDILTTNQVLTSQEPTKYSFSPGDYVYPLWLYPFLEMMQPTDTMPIEDYNIPRFSWNFQAREYEQ